MVEAKEAKKKDVVEKKKAANLKVEADAKAVKSATDNAAKEGAAKVEAAKSSASDAAK